MGGTCVSSGWVSARTGATVSAPAGMVSLALRRNPRRAHLLVSALLGKHIPVPATDVLAAADRLGVLVHASLPAAPVVVLGFAETATALGHGVALALRLRGMEVTYAHTTRRPVPPDLAALSFDEEHSHAVEQLLAVTDLPDGVLVLVDDELSTGQTAVNAIAVLQSRWPRSHYVLASLLDVRSADQRDSTRAQVEALGAALTDVSLASGEVSLPDDLPTRAAELVSSVQPSPVRRTTPVAVRSWQLTLPPGTPLTGAHGWSSEAEAGLSDAVALAAAVLRPLLTGPVLCLGDEEFMWAGQRLAAVLGASTSTTTRSPVLVVDEAGYPIRTALLFPAGDDPHRKAFAYNVAASEYADPGPAPGFDAIVLVLDRPVSSHVREGLVARLASAARMSVEVVVVREGFGSSSAQDGSSSFEQVQA